MQNKILILGGYGNFGKRISKTLVSKNIPIIISGRNKIKATNLKNNLLKEFKNAKIDIEIFDADKELSQKLKQLKPKILINTKGPFQSENYDIVKNCIDLKINYIDLADARDFVTNIGQFDNLAKKNNIAIISGASTVPGLSSAVIEKYKSKFKEIESLKYGITPGAKAPRGLNTTKAILSYVGRPLKPAGKNLKRYGWQDLYIQDYPILGKRWMANCDVPDLDLFTEKYAIKDIKFSAGMESSLLHLSIWLVSWVIRLMPKINLAKYAKIMLSLSKIFDIFGTPHGGMHIIIKGKDKTNKVKTIKWFIIAKNNYGPFIPTIPAIIIAKKIFFNEQNFYGAKACMGLVTLEEYLKELSDYDIKTYEFS